MKFVDYLLDASLIRLIKSSGDIDEMDSRLLEILDNSSKIKDVEKIIDTTRIIEMELDYYNGGFRGYFEARLNKLKNYEGKVIELSRMACGYGN